MDIRALSADDLERVCAIHARSFAATAHGHQGEADLVRALHLEGDVLVSLIAEQEGEPMGHVVFSRMHVIADDVPVPAAALAPIAVAPEHQGVGIGSALIRAGHERLAAMGIALAFVLGEPVYYARFGYEVALARPFASPYGGPYFAALALDERLAKPQWGSAEHAPAFAGLG